MALDNAKNFAKVTVSTGYDAAATGIVLTSGGGALLPTVPFNLVWWNSTDYSDPSDDPNVEIVRCTVIATDTLTVTRAQESTSAKTKNTAGKTYKMIAGLTAKVVNTDLAASAYLSPLAAGSVAVGNGTAGDKTGTITSHVFICDTTTGAVSTNFIGLGIANSAYMVADTTRMGWSWNGSTNGTYFGANVFGWYSGAGGGSVLDTGLSRLGAASLAIGNGVAGDVTGTLTLATEVKQSANAAQWIQGQISELITLSTSGTTTDSAANLLPTNSIIEAVVARVIVTITTATDWELGDGTIAGRFSAPNSTMTAGTTQVGTVQVDQTGTSGPRQVAAAKLRITTTGTPGAGQIRVTVFYRQFVAPTS